MTPVEQPRPLEGYEPFFGLREAPFSLAPDPRFLFASSSHAPALAQVTYALQRREPLVVVTGEIGTGKTLLCRTLLQRLPGKTFLSVITDPQLDRDDLLKQMLQDFGVISKDRTRLTDTTRHELVQALEAFLTSLSPLQAHAVVIVDEAQHLHPEVLEQIRLLSNIGDARGTALEIILVGQPDLEELLARPELKQLQQRVSRWLRLSALTRDEVTLYVEHRMARARAAEPADGASGAAEFSWDLIESAGVKRNVEFTADAIDAISQISEGVPRVINLLCDRSLENAYGSRRHRIDGPLIHAAARELGLEARAVPEPPAALRLAPRPAEISPADIADSVWPLEPSAAKRADESMHAAEPAAPVVLEPSVPIARPAISKYVLVALVVIAVAGAVLFGLRNTRSQTAAPAPGRTAVSPPPRTSAAPPAAANTGSRAAAPPATGGAAAPSSNAAPATAIGDQFELVIASFRTDARAAAVAAEVSALGLPIRRRASDGWQQVIAGPFASRSDAEAAQQRLDAAGLTGAQLAPAVR